MTDEQLKLLEAWRDQFHPDVMAWLERIVRSSAHYKEPAASGFAALLAMAQSLAVRQ